MFSGENLCSTHNFDQRNQMWRVERMTDYAALRVLAVGLDGADFQS